MLRKSPHTTRRNFLKQTGGLTLASAFGLGFVANRQQLLAETSGGGGSPPPPSPPPTYCIRYVFSTETGLASTVSGSATGLGSFDIHMQVSMDPEPQVFNCSPTVTATFRARVWTTGGNGNTVTGYNTAGYPRVGQTWPFAGVTVGGGDVAKEVKAEITVTFSSDTHGNLVMSGGDSWSSAEEEKLVENLGNDLRVRKVVSRVKLKRNGLKIEARGWVGHMFDGFLIDANNKITEGIQNDLYAGNINNHPHFHIPGGVNEADFPFKRTYEVRGPYVMDPDGTC